MLERALEKTGAQLTAAEKRELLGRLLSRLAHEIRNPLSSLDVHVQLLDEDLAGLTPQLRGRLTPRLDIIQGELHRLKRITENFLRLAGPSVVDLEPVELPPLLTHVVELLRPEAALREVRIVTEFSELPRIPGDPVRLTQALLNLLINALQAVDRKGEIHLKAVAEKNTVAVAVEDNGPGIPPERMAVIFDPYFTTKTEGSGLGLWIAEQIVSAHGGTLQADNAPSGGALLTMRLPTGAGASAVGEG